MVYGTYNYSYWGESKPTYNWGASHCKIRCTASTFLGICYNLSGRCFGLCQWLSENLGWIWRDGSQWAWLLGCVFKFVFEDKSDISWNIFLPRDIYLKHLKALVPKQRLPRWFLSISGPVHLWGCIGWFVWSNLGVTVQKVITICCWDIGYNNLSHHNCKR